MEKPAALKLRVAKNSPSATERSVAFVLAFPGKLDCGHSASLGESTVKTALYRDELKLSHALAIELNEGWDNEVQVITTP